MCFIIVLREIERFSFVHVTVSMVTYSWPCEIMWIARKTGDVVFFLWEIELDAKIACSRIIDENDSRYVRINKWKLLVRFHESYQLLQLSVFC